MPQILSKLESHRVNEILRRRGWAFHRQSNIGLRLTKKDPNPENVFKSTGQRKRILMTPISRVHLDEILTVSRNLQEAVEQIEAISIGAQLSPEFAHMSANGAAGVSPAVMEKLLLQRMENEMAKITEANQAKLDAAEKKMAALEAKLEKAQETPKAAKPKKVPGERKQPKGGVVERLKRQQEMDENGDPVLTVAQEAEMAKAMVNAGRQD